ncbi:predicted protein [Uncinocarpus reesii 1704]|uniref:C2 domain-containing protein n=1 Tax=Uncinocarpus reesii (strain UAMH 1704) TaxID=336963 RepID=C4JWX2_UNCRE|nr:uncharacterized protein UREG_06145 [Uncinocarpus reesii 1704]EEP81280.1 predicted protein [Uncinocarpus reesii 1704]
MLSKSAQLALGAHTAGIYADMSIDGPQIGTLVAIIDRAKNLPNRKTMGKQNPYCACRLAKEAKKTDTDMRGGQTPKWDQELRFTVHESPDYYQLKVSVFNDDKKTDLIGETWVDLKSVIIPGGGQSDSWHSLSCKGKYAGELRIELTYYDTRPKDEAVVERRKEAKKTEARHQTSSSVSGPRQSKPPKRRPLPADPTGAIPEKSSSVETSAAPKRDTPAPEPHRPQPPEQVRSTSPSKVSRAPETSDEQGRKRRAHETYPPVQSSGSSHHQSSYHPDRQNYGDIPDNPYPAMHDFPSGRQAHHHEAGFSEQPARVRQPYQNDPQSSHPHSHISNPLRQPQDYSNEPQSIASLSTIDNYHQHELSSHQSVPSSMPPGDNHLALTSHRHEYQEFHGDTDVYQEAPGHSHASNQYQPYTPDSYEPASRHVTRQIGAPERLQTSYASTSRGPPLENLDLQRYSTLDHSSQLVVRPGGHRGHQHRYSTSTKPDVHRESPLRQTASQTNYQHRQYMQPHVQDDDDNGPPPPPPAHRDGLGVPPASEQFTSQPQHVPMPEPLSIAPRTSPRPVERQSEYIPYCPQYADSNFTPDSNQVYSTSPAPSYRSMTQEPNYLQERPATSGSDSVPPSLVAGYDSNLVKEPDWALPDRHGYRQGNTPTQPSTLTQVMRSFPAGLPERKSPKSVDPSQIPARKSVSPHPAPSVDPDSLPGIPFSPESYDAINPNASLASGVEQPAPPYESVEQAMEAARQHEVEKIRTLGPIIGNDGRTIDPSDHLPADTWAPEPVRKSKKPEVVVRFKHTPGSSAASSRSLTTDRERQPRPMSMIAPNHGYQSSSVVTAVQSQPSRSRLQKLTSRPQSYIQPSPSARDPSPRPNNTFPNRDSFVAHNLHSTSPTNVNTPRHYNSSAPPPYSDASPSPSPRYSPSTISHHYHASGPPIPAKVPIQPGSRHYPGMPSADGDINALSEEMKRIDIGIGKRGRKGHTSFMGGYGQ